MKKGAIFDLDGTLVDSMSVWQKVDNEIADKYNLELDEEYWEKVTTYSFLEGAAYINERFKLGKTAEDIADELYAIALDEYKYNVELKPGAKELLKNLKADGFKLAIATSNAEEMTVAVLENNDILKYFDEFVYCDTVGKNKSFPDVYILAASKLGLNANECYVFEDIISAVEGAKKSGAEVIGVYDEHSANKEREMRLKADRYLMSLDEFKYWVLIKSNYYGIFLVVKTNVYNKRTEVATWRRLRITT